MEMTYMTVEQITATKISVDNLKIKLEYPQGKNQAQPYETTNHSKVYQLNKIAQKIALWLMAIITLITTLNMCAGIITTGALMFANYTRVYMPSSVPSS